MSLLVVCDVTMPTCYPLKYMKKVRKKNGELLISFPDGDETATQKRHLDSLSILRELVSKLGEMRELSKEEYLAVKRTICKKSKKTLLLSNNKCYEAMAGGLGTG